VNSKKLLYVMCFILLLLGIAGTVWAQSAAYNRPNPSMDYVPQELGIYDTMYNELTEQNCRTCHGDSTSDRHQGVPMVVRDHLCHPCHPTCTEGAPDCENGITIHRDCLTSDCHSWNDVQFGNQKWHHNTDLTDSENCIACHNPNLIEEIGPFRSFTNYPPSVTISTPFVCEKCHWEQPASVTGDANAPGHPSTYAHYDELGNYIGFYEYGMPIFNNIDTHHLDFVGEVASECYKCHSQDPGNPGWDPYNKELIRYCEICHSWRTLHNPVLPHVSYADGWLPVGFHANPGSPPVRGGGGPGPYPKTYAKWGSIDYTPQVNPGFYDNQMCYACHGGFVIPWADVWGPGVPAIDAGGISPNHGSCGMIVTLRGDFFGEEHFFVEEHIEGSNEVQMKLKADPLAPWITVPIHAWTNNLIEIQIPCGPLAPGNYLVRVQQTYYGNRNSNRVAFTLKDHPTLLNITPASAPCNTVITLSGNGFQNQRSRILPDQTYYGVHHVVDFVASNGEFTATRYANWSDKQIQVKVYDWFQDEIDTCSINPNTGQPRNERNFVQDIGDENADANITCDNIVPAYDECTTETLIPKCDCFALETFQVYVKAIYFGDDDASGDLSCGDTIFQVETSEPHTFELTNVPYINRINPKQIIDVNDAPYPLLKIFGVNFGLTQKAGDSVRIGKKLDALRPTLGLGKEQTKVVLWSDALIKVRAKQIPNIWRGKMSWVWIEKGGMKSNIKPLAILSPLP